MNWLAHLYLSEPSPAFRLGNLLPDLASMSALAALPSEYQPGILQHRRIDRFTDSHPVFRRSKARLGPAYRRFSGILADIFYDHVLAREWESYAQVPLPTFAQDVYAAIADRWEDLPKEARPRLKAMRTANWLCRYQELDGIWEAVARLGRYLRHPTNLTPAVALVAREYSGFREDFAEFFPALGAHIGFDATRQNSSAATLSPSTAPPDLVKARTP